MSMVEKVARAILNAHAGDIPVHDADLQWSWWIEEARAAIEAMREPTPEMIDAGRFRYTLADETVEKSWGYMIQAALEGEG